MWCPHCQRDVPRAAGATVGGHKCGDCGRGVAVAREPHGAHNSAAWLTATDDGLDLESTQLRAPIPRSRALWDEWTLAAEVRRARHLLSPGGVSGAAAEWRIDDLHRLIAETAAGRGRRASGSESYRGGNVRPKWRKASLAALVLGIGAFGVGVASAAAFVDVSGTISRIGIPLMLVGLFGLLLGLLIQVLSISRASSAAVDRMRLVELRLQEYRQAALLVGPAPHVGGAQHADRLGRANASSIAHWA